MQIFKQSKMKGLGRPKFVEAGTIAQLESRVDTTEASVAVIEEDITTINSVKEFVAMVSQTGTSAPTFEIIKNTLGVAPSATYSSAGVYRVAFAGVDFNSEKTFPQSKSIMISATSNVTYVLDDNSGLRLSLFTSTSGTPTNTLLAQYPIKFTIYP